VLDETGAGREVLSADDVPDMDCDSAFSGPCVIDADGHDTSISYTGRVLGVTPQSVATGSPPELATAVLLDESQGTGTFDRAGLRLVGVNRFLESIMPPDSATVASYQDPGGSPEMRVLGEFTSDARSLEPAVAAVAGHESGASPTLAALTSVVAYVNEHTASGGAAPARSVVVVTHNFSGGDCWYVNPCQNAAQDAVGSALAAGISVNAVGVDGAITWAVARTGGFFADVRDPSQLPVVLRNVNSLIARNVACHRVRMELRTVTGAFTPGGVAFANLSVRIGPDTRLMFTMAAPI
jgi:hypothetical protein